MTQRPPHPPLTHEVPESEQERHVLTADEMANAKGAAWLPKPWLGEPSAYLYPGCEEGPEVTVPPRGPDGT